MSILRPVLPLIAVCAFGCAGAEVAPDNQQGDLLPADGGALHCVTDLRECNGRCVNLYTDDSACGHCGNVCSGGWTCQGGVCTAMATACPKGQSMCGTKCADLTTDATNCGACGTACAADETCAMGQCASNMMCAQGQTLCGGQCVDLAVDVANCGACGTACMNRQTCAAGRCVGGGCPQGQTMCRGVCTDVTTDPTNCGACGAACRNGQMCAAGRCMAGGGGNMTGCNGAVTCINGCMTQMCEQGCIDNTTQQGVMLLQALIDCIDAACPSTNGGVCDSMGQRYSAKACDNCVAASQAVGGRCHAALKACNNNLP